MLLLGCSCSRQIVFNVQPYQTPQDPLCPAKDKIRRFTWRCPPHSWCGTGLCNQLYPHSVESSCGIGHRCLVLYLSSREPAQEFRLTPSATCTGHVWNTAPSFHPPTCRWTWGLVNCANQLDVSPLYAQQFKTKLKVSMVMCNMGLFPNPLPHIQGVGLPSFAVDGQMVPSSWQYQSSCWFRFVLLAEILGPCLAIHDTRVQRLRLPTNMGCSPHPLSTYKVLGKTSYAVVEKMEALAWPLHQSTCWSRFVLWAEILGHCWATNDTGVQRLRLSTNMGWSSHPLPTYTRCLTNHHMLWLRRGDDLPLEMIYFYYKHFGTNTI